MHHVAHLMEQMMEIMWLASQSHFYPSFIFTKIQFYLPLFLV